MATSTEQINRRIYMSSKKKTVSSCEIDGDAPGGKVFGSVWPKAVLCVVCGIIFGIAMHKAHGKRIDIVVLSASPVVTGSMPSSNGLCAHRWYQTEEKFPSTEISGHGNYDTMFRAQ